MLSQGDVIKGIYKIEKILGKGGMGAVYYCSESDKSDQIWAIKEMNIPTTDPELKSKALRHFEIEAEILSRLKHFNLPGVKEYFQENNNYYLVMEYIEGESLGKLLDKSAEPFSEELVLKWGTQLSTVIYFLHIQNPKIIYRDLKPSNIIIDLKGNVKLIDFGIARFFRSDKKKDTVQMGSIGYAPPEQFGQGQTDERSDIYSLGVTLHQLLTKRDPAEADNPFDIPLLRKLNNNASIELERVIQRATQFEAERRYQKAIEIKRDLKMLYDERMRKSQINFPVYSNQPPTIAINSLEMSILAAPAEIKSEEKVDNGSEKKAHSKIQEEIKIEKKEFQEVEKEKITGDKNKNVSDYKENAVEKEEKLKPDDRLENRNNDVKKPDQEEIKKEVENKNVISGKKSKFSLRFALNLMVIILVLSLAGGTYYLYLYPDKIPSWLSEYIPFSRPTEPPAPVAIETPTMAPTQNPDFFRDQAYEKYYEKNYDEAKKLLEESLRISPYNPEAMLLNSNIDITMNNIENFSIGMVISRSGKSEEEGESMMRGACIALEEINNKWGVRGKMLKLEILDDESNLNSAVNLFHKEPPKDLIALIGPGDYVIDMAIAPFAKKYNILHISPSLSMDYKLINSASTAFGLSPDRHSEIKAMEHLIYDNFKKDKIAILYDIQNPYFLELNYIFKEEILSGERNITEILLRGEHVEEQAEVDRIISIISEEEPEILIFLTSPYIIKQLAVEIRKVDNNLIFLGGHWAYSGLLLDKPELDGCLCLCPVAETENKDFIEAYKRTFPDVPLDFTAIQIYDAIKLITDCINTKGFRKEDIETYLMEFDEKNSYKGKSGNIYFGVNEKDNIGKWKVLQIINGQFQDLYPI